MVPLFESETFKDWYGGEPASTLTGPLGKENSTRKQLRIAIFFSNKPITLKNTKLTIDLNKIEIALILIFVRFSAVLV